MLACWFFFEFFDFLKDEIFHIFDIRLTIKYLKCLYPFNIEIIDFTMLNDYKHKSL